MIFKNTFILFILSILIIMGVCVYKNAIFLWKKLGNKIKFNIQINFTYLMFLGCYSFPRAFNSN